MGMMNWRHLAVLIMALGLAGLWLVRSPAETETVFPMPAGRLYVQKCGSCHTAYAPGLLPSRSWQQLMENLGAHFGTDASLDEPHHLAILKELETLAADGNYAGMRMRRIAAAIPMRSKPTRITTTTYFKSLHEAVPSALWARKPIERAGNCLACHPRANSGHFDARELRVPGA